MDMEYRRDLIQLAQSSLGKASASWTEALRPDELKEIIFNTQLSEPIEIVLFVVFSGIQAGTDSAEDMRHEFFGFIYSHLTDRRGRTKDFPRIRSFANTHDLLGEVIIDLLENSRGIEFRGLSSFCALVWKRMGWKAQQIARKKGTGPLSSSDTEHLLPSKEISPARKSEVTEMAELMDVLLGKLHPRQRELIQMYLVGTPYTVIEKHFNLSPSAARKQVQRILDHLRKGGIEGD
jgi:RNA polymerase sigma factor (sigma-70 family)